MDYQEITLSILIVCHRQKEVLRLCIDSILKQEIQYPSEIIISDDRSMDGTLEMLEEYSNSFPGLITYLSANSDECNPANTSQRSGWNRCNAYQKARGKYIVHVDADDYFTGTDVLQAQVDMLENHPGCSLCMQNIWVLNEGAVFETGHPWFPLHKFKNEQIISAKEFIQEDYFILNQAFVMRRNPDVDPVELYGKRYVDSVITYHHLQFGNIVCVDHCDYVYIKHPSAITSSLSETDKSVLWCLPVYIPLLIPTFTGLHFASHLKEILHLVNIARKGKRITKASADSIKDMGAYIYDIFSKQKFTCMDQIRMNIARFYLMFMIRLSFRNALALRILYKLIISNKIDKNVYFGTQ